MATTITVDDDTLERFNTLKANTSDENVPELSADQFLKSLLDAWEENNESIYGDFEALDGIKNQLDRIESAQANTVTEALETAENADMDTDEILGRIDDLEARLPRKVAEEVHR